MIILTLIIVGALAGWLGSVLYHGGRLGLLGNLVVGIIGSFIGYWLFGLAGVSLRSELLAAVLTGAIGAIVILFILNLVKKKP